MTRKWGFFWKFACLWKIDLLVCDFLRENEIYVCFWAVCLSLLRCCVYFVVTFCCVTFICGFLSEDLSRSSSNSFNWNQLGEWCVCTHNLSRVWCNWLLPHLLVQVVGLPRICHNFWVPFLTKVHHFSGPFWGGCPMFSSLGIHF